MSQYASGQIGLPPGGIRPIGADLPPGPDGGGVPALSDPLVVKLQVGAGETLVPWAGHDIRVTTKVGELPTATLAVELARGQAVNIGSDATPIYRRIDELVFDDQVFIIRTARANPATDVELFRGTLRSVRHSIVGGDTIELELEHVAAALRDDPKFQLAGPARLNVAQYSTSEPIDACVLSPGETLVFNPQGRGNCFRRMMDGSSAQQPQMPVHWTPFTNDAEPWSWARVFAHLLGRARLQAHPEAPALRRELVLGDYIELPDGTRLTDWNLSRLIHDRALLSFNLNTPVGSVVNPLVRALLTKPVNFAPDCLSVWDAIKYACMQCGIGVVWEWRRPASSDEPAWGMRFFAPEFRQQDVQPQADQDGVRQLWVFLPGEQYTTHDRTRTQLDADANLQSAVLTREYAAVRNRGRGLGRAQRYEVTLELAPLWTANAEWDLPTASQSAIDAAIAASQATSWANKYNTNGSSHALLWAVGRLWGLVTLPDLRGFARGFPPFDASRYDLFDLYEVGRGVVPGIGSPAGHIVEAAVAQATLVRSRIFEPLTTLQAAHKPMQPLIEVSFTSGTAWRPIAADVEISPFDARVLFRAEDLRAVANPDSVSANDANFVNAYIARQLRVRVTAGLRGDAPVDTFELATAPGLSLSRRARTRVRRYGGADRWMRDEVGPTGPGPEVGPHGGNSQFRGLPLTHPTAARDDLDTMTLDVVRRMQATDRLRYPGSITLTDLVFYDPGDGVDPETQAGYRPGDTLLGIQDRSASADGLGDVIFAGNATERGAMISAITWAWSQGTPGAGGMAANTVLTLESPDPVAAVQHGLRGGD